MVRTDEEDAVDPDVDVPDVTDVLTLNSVEKNVGVYDALEDNKLLFVDTPGADVIFELEEEGPSVILLLLSVAIDEYVLDLDVSIDEGTVSKVTSEEDIVTDSEGVSILDTDVLVRILEDERVCSNVVLGTESM